MNNISNYIADLYAKNIVKIALKSITGKKILSKYIKITNIERDPFTMKLSIIEGFYRDNYISIDSNYNGGFTIIYNDNEYLIKNDIVTVIK